MHMSARHAPHNAPSSRNLIAHANAVRAVRRPARHHLLDRDEGRVLLLAQQEAHASLFCRTHGQRRREISQAHRARRQLRRPARSARAAPARRPRLPRPSRAPTLSAGGPRTRSAQGSCVPPDRPAAAATVAAASATYGRGPRVPGLSGTTSGARGAGICRTGTGGHGACRPRAAGRACCSRGHGGAAGGWRQRPPHPHGRSRARPCGRRAFASAARSTARAGPPAAPRGPLRDPSDRAAKPRDIACAARGGGG